MKEAAVTDSVVEQAVVEQALIEQAKGALGAWYGLGPDDASDRLATLSRERGLPVAELAAEIVAALPEASRRAQRGHSPVPEPPDWSRRAAIEQAKGVLAAWYGLDPASATRRLATLADIRGVPRETMAAQIVAEGAGHEAPAWANGVPAPAPWLYRLVDGLVDAAMVLVPVHGRDDDAGTVEDLVIEHVNDLMADPYGRSKESLVGRRLAAAYPGSVPSGLYDAYLEAIRTERAYRMDRQALTERTGDSDLSALVRIHAVPVCGRLVVTWRDDAVAEMSAEDGTSTEDAATG